MVAGSGGRNWPGSWPEHEIFLSPEVLGSAKARARDQTAAYGHDSGYFHLGRRESSHEIGTIGEIAARDFLRKLLIESGISCELNLLGATHDITIKLNDKVEGLHVKTGRYRTWPLQDQPFGVHFGQRLEMTAGGLILVSLLAGIENVARIEGILLPIELSKCNVLEKGEPFPGRTYTSRTCNRLTFLRDYKEVTPVLIESILGR
jgi:hypothetical protein